MSKQRESLEARITAQLEFYEDHCPVCKQELYIGDPPAAGRCCVNPRCPECSIETLEEYAEEE